VLMLADQMVRVKPASGWQLGQKLGIR
jgi:hypothetical protein